MKFNIHKKQYVIFLLIITSILITSHFYGRTIYYINQYCWGGGGDALQSYVNFFYHAKYDTTYMYHTNLNYPYGENAFFANGQFPITSLLISLKKIGVDLSGYTIAIINLEMFISLLLSIVILYLIFRKLGLPQVYSFCFAIGVGFLSPQINRFVGHFTLGYMFAIPLAFYLLLLHYYTQKYKHSIILGITTFTLSLFHIYYLGLIGAMVICYWLFLFISEKRYRNLKRIIFNFSYQLIIPFLLIHTWIWIIDQSPDRTNNPWGFFFYLSYWEGIFIPLNTPLEQYYTVFFYVDSKEFEGIAYVGSVASFVAVVLIFLTIWKIYKWKLKTIFWVTDIHILNVFFWTGLLTLLFSFGLPFTKFESLYNHIGIIRQMRGVGRFAWLFFYAMNITAFYLIYKWSVCLLPKWKYAATYIFFIPLFIDAYLHNNGLGDYLIKYEVEFISDRKNELPENRWIEKISLQNYQAILPLPYFHVGSESIWYGNETSFYNHALILSAKTGLPTLAVHLSRTSLSQTYKSLALVLEPYRPLKIIKDFPNQKPFLVIADKDLLKENEKYLFNKCKFILDNGKFQVYELPFEALHSYSDLFRIQVKEEIKGLNISQNIFYTTDSLQGFLHESFDYLDSKNISYRGKGAFTGPGDNKFTVFERKIPNARNLPYNISFWIADIDKDLYARTVFILEVIKNGKTIHYDENSISRYMQTIDNNWALFEREFPISYSDAFIRLSLKNNIAGNKNIIIDELLIRPASVNVYKSMNKEIYKNNRFYRF